MKIIPNVPRYDTGAKRSGIGCRERAGYSKEEEKIMKKKLLALGLAATMAASLAGCGGNKTAETTTAATEAVATTEAASETSAEAADTEAESTEAAPELFEWAGSFLRRPWLRSRP